MPRIIMLKYCLSILLFGWWTTGMPSPVDTDTLRSCQAFRVSEAPKIDGRLMEKEWMLAEPTGHFIQSRPDEGRPATQKTEVRVLYTDFAIYVGAWCYDSSPDSILKQLGVRDNNDLNADNFFLKIDPYNNNQDAYQFGVHASGVQMDSRFSDPTYDAVWNSEVCSDGLGWYVEMEIPYSAIRFPAVEMQEWGLQFTRLVRRNREFQMWALVPSTASNPQLHWGHLKGISQVKTPVRLSITPYMALSYDHDPFYNEDGTYSYSNLTSYSFGADIKYGIDDRFTLDLTLLPDFGQVQSDRIVKNLSYREVVYDENRPFFKEATELFSKGNLFYSRRIGKIPGGYYSVFNEVQEDENLVENPSQVKLLNAMKISGRTDKGLGIGFFNALTDNTYAVAENKNGEKRRMLTEPLTNYNIIVLDQQFKNNSNIYFINTSTIRREDFDDANVSGAGLKLSNKKNTYLVSAEGVLTQNFSVSKSEEGNVFMDRVGYKYSVGAEKLGGNFGYGAYRNVTSPDYDATDLGFFRVAGQNNTEGYFRFNRYRPWKFIRESYNNLSLFVADDFRTGRIGDNSINLSLFANLMSWNAVFAGGGAQLIRPYDYYEARTPGQVFKGLRYYYLYAGFSSDYRKKLAVDYNFNISNFIDRFTWFGYNNSLSFRIRPNDKLFIVYEIQYNYDPFNVGYATATEEGLPLIGGRRLDTWENSIRGSYIFKNNMGLTLIGRHYWITGQYKRFFNLDESGEMTENISYHQNNNFNFNIFNVDLIYEWRFSPGSILNIVYKNSISSETGVVHHHFGNNFRNLIKDPQASTVAIKFLYYLDYLRVHGRMAKKYHRSPAQERSSFYAPEINVAKRNF
ncbi:MAG: carbohydrate binding family 9 domain-containing protein [Bacteroidia bacterium]|nr:carbohydrate binding family 9 domain-containing protein [Bacteroidia bacterium]